MDKFEKIKIGFWVFFIFCVGFLIGFFLTIMEPQYTKKASPSDILNYTDIKIYKNMACIMMDNLTMSRIASTNSMDPCLDKEAHILRYVPDNISEIHIGDIVSFEFDNETIIHRVIDIKDNRLLTKGDNNKWKDGWVEFEKVKGKLVAVIY